MKCIKIFSSLLILLLVGLLGSIVGHCDALDDLVAEYGDAYVWTVEAELDDTYKDTWLYEVSDNGKVKISYMNLTKDVEITDLGDPRPDKVKEVCIIEGKISVIFPLFRDSNTAYTSYGSTKFIVKKDGEYVLASRDHEENPLYDYFLKCSEKTDDGLAYLYKSLSVNIHIWHYKHKDDGSLYVTFRDVNCTPIYIDAETFLVSAGVAKGDDNRIKKGGFYPYGGFANRRGIPFTEYILATPVEREGLLHIPQDEEPEDSSNDDNKEDYEEEDTSIDNNTEDYEESVDNSTDEEDDIKIDPSIMFIPVPTEPQGEPVLNPDLPLAPEEGDIRVTIGGRELSFDVAPMIENERVLVPLRAVFENLGADVTWDEDSGVITITDDDVYIEFAVNETDVSVNDEIKYMDAPARIVEDRTLVPLRFLSEELGYTVTWDEESRLVTID